MAEIRDHVGKEIGPIAKSKTVLLVSELLKTRSGKIMRRLLRDPAKGREVDPGAVQPLSLGLADDSEDQAAASCLT